jgi:hypothetical protein
MTSVNQYYFFNFTHFVIFFFISSFFFHSTLLACDTKHIECCYKGSTDCLCLRSACCLSVSSKSRGCCCVGDEKKGECCKIACFCCDCGLIWPTKICAGASQVCCCYSVQSLPCSDQYVEECVCAFCFIQCCPTCGICAA